MQRFAQRGREVPEQGLGCKWREISQTLASSRLLSGSASPGHLFPHSCPRAKDCPQGGGEPWSAGVLCGQHSREDYISPTRAHATHQAFWHLGEPQGAGRGACGFGRERSRVWKWSSVTSMPVEPCGALLSGVHPPRAPHPRRPLPPPHTKLEGAEPACPSPAMPLHTGFCPTGQL